MRAKVRQRTTVRKPVIFEIAEVMAVFDFCTGGSPEGGSSQPLPKRG
jgi:hypothetical protein